MSRFSRAGFQPTSKTLPPGWTMTALGQVVLKKVEQEAPGGSGTIRYIDISSVDNAAKVITEAKLISAAMAPSRARQIVVAGDVLVSMTRPNLNAVAVVPQELTGATASTGFDVLRPGNTVLSDWLFLHVRSQQFVAAMTTLVQGALYPAVRPADIRNYPIPLPPLAEQRRIVARLEALMTRSRRAREKLAKVPAQLAKARQSLLAAAFRGDLTADWRDGRAVKRAHSPEADAETAWTIPDNWTGTRLENLIPSGGLFDGPFGSNLKSDDYTQDGVRVIRLENIGHLSFDDEKQTFVSKEKHSTLKRHTVSEGDLIFASFIFEPVRVCILPQLSTQAIAKADCFCLRPDARLVDREFLCFQLASPGVGHRLADWIHGATRPRINTTQLRKLGIAWCPLSEQREIVRRLTAALTKLDAAAIAHTAAVAALDRFDQSLLARAFSGGLVPPEAAPSLAPTTPPASVQAQLYLLRFIPALLRAAGHPVPLADLNAVVALRFLPATVLLPVVERLGGAPARAHFAAFAPVTYEDGAFLAVMQRLRQANAIAVSPDRRGVSSLSLGPTPPPSTPAVDADARHLAPLLSHVPVERVEPILRRLQSAEVQEALLTAP